MEHIKCNLCSADDYVVIEKDRKFGEEITNVVCKKCGLVYQNPRFTEKETEEFYSSASYRKLKYNMCCINPEYELAGRWEANPRFDYIISHIKKSELKKKRVLDIGCNIGALLLVFRDAGFDVKGIEPSKVMSAHGRKEYNLNIKTGFLSDIKPSDGPFEIITLVHVLEHFLDPTKELLRIRKLMTDKSHLYVEIPEIYHTKENFHAFMQLAHPYTFSLKTVTALLEKTGFSVLNHKYGTKGLMMLCQKKKAWNPGNKNESIKSYDNYRNVVSFVRKYQTDFYLYGRFITLALRKMRDKVSLLAIKTLFKILGTYKAKKTLKMLKNA